jgi:hypothetical protein
MAKARFFVIRARASLIAAIVAASAGAAHAAPPVPSGAHPRLFMNADQIAGYAANVASKGTAAAKLVNACQATIDKPGDYTMRGGSDGNTWPAAALSCAFAYQVTKDAKYLTQANTYLRAALSDDQTLGDKAGCVSTNWQSWDGNPPNRTKA